LPAVNGARRLETWLWSGPLGHLIGGALDFAEAMLRWQRARRRERAARRADR
jgi:hypothetical protein